MSFFNKALHTVKRTVASATTKDHSLDHQTTEHETQFEISKNNFERFHTVLTSLNGHMGVYVEATMNTMSRSAMITNELANILVEESNENLFPQWSSMATMAATPTTTTTATTTANTITISLLTPINGNNNNAHQFTNDASMHNNGGTPSNIPSEQIERMNSIKNANASNELVHNRREFQNFLSNLRTSHQMFNVDSTFSTFRASAQRALKAIQDEIDYHNKIFATITRRTQLREELVYYTKKVSTMEQAKLKKGNENQKEREKLERNINKKEEIERMFIGLTNDLIRQMNFQYANRGTILLPFTTNFYISEENWSQSFAAALQQVRMTLQSSSPINQNVNTLSQDFQKDMNIAPAPGYNGGPQMNYSPPQQASYSPPQQIGQNPPPNYLAQPPPHPQLHLQDATNPSEQYNPFNSPVNSYNVESEFVKNGRRPSMDKDAYAYSDPNSQKVFY